jgi:hypothetical protein
VEASTLHVRTAGPPTATLWLRQEGEVSAPHAAGLATRLLVQTFSLATREAWVWSSFLIEPQSTKISGPVTRAERWVSGLNQRFAKPP